MIQCHLLDILPTKERLSVLHGLGATGIHVYGEAHPHQGAQAQAVLTVVHLGKSNLHLPQGLSTLAALWNHTGSF